MNSTDILDAVTNINMSIFNVIGDEVEGVHLEYCTDSVSECVMFNGISLWSSESEGTPYNDDGNTELPFEPYLRGLLVEHLANMAKLYDAFRPEAPTAAVA